MEGVEFGNQQFYKSSHLALSWPTPKAFLSGLPPKILQKPKSVPIAQLTDPASLKVSEILLDGSRI